MSRKSITANQDQAAEPDGEGQSPAKKPLTPARCRTHLRRELSREFENILKGFVEQAKTGSCQHLKLTTELLAIEPGKKEKKEARSKRGPGPVTALLLKMQQMEAEEKGRVSNQASRP